MLDGADAGRGGCAVNYLFTTKAAVLSGDFLLARASVALATLDHPLVVKKMLKEMAKLLEALVQGHRRSRHRPRSHRHRHHHRHRLRLPLEHRRRMRLLASTLMLLLALAPMELSLIHISEPTRPY